MPLLLAGGTPLKLHHRGQQQENFLVALDNVASRDAADAWRGKEIFAQRIHLPPTAEAEFYVTDLQGMGAFDASGQALGTVTAVYDFGAGASLEITGLDRKTHIVPFNNRCVPQVDMAAQKIVVEMLHEIVVLPEGQHHD